LGDGSRMDGKSAPGFPPVPRKGYAIRNPAPLLKSPAHGTKSPPGHGDRERTGEDGRGAGHEPPSAKRSAARRSRGRHRYELPVRTRSGLARQAVDVPGRRTQHRRRDARQALGPVRRDESAGDGGAAANHPQGVLPRRHRGLRRGVLRYFPARGGLSRSAAAGDPRTGLGGTGRRRNRAAVARRFRGRGVRRRELQRLRPAAAGGHPAHRRLCGQRHHLLRHGEPHLLFPGPARAEHGRRHGVRRFADRAAPGLLIKTVLALQHARRPARWCCTGCSRPGRWTSS
jgi:hypothetical protein